MKNVKGIVLIFGALTMLTGCQEKKTSTTKNSSSVTATESKSSDKSSSSEKNSSKPEIEEISAENFQKMLKNKGL